MLGTICSILLSAQLAVCSTSETALAVMTSSRSFALHNPSATSTAAVVNASPTQQRAEHRDVYTPYLGSGTTEDGWPPRQSWLDFNSMWRRNAAVMRASCVSWGVQNNNEREMVDLKDAIRAVGNITAVDIRFVLAIVLQESKGCVRVITTAYSHDNPGLMQSYNGSGTCNSNTAPLGLPGVEATGTVQVPCPRSEIFQMILDGTNGTHWGPGLADDYRDQGRSDVSGYYRTARLYNGGSLSADGNLIGPCCTPSYASDIANRLMGWVDAPSDFPG